MPSNGTYEEHIVSDTNTTNFEHSISVKKYKFGPETNRTILIYIYDFQTPLKVIVSSLSHFILVTQRVLLKFKSS